MVLQLGGVHARYRIGQKSKTLGGVKYKLVG